MTRRGRPFNSEARKIVLESIKQNPNINFHRLWKIVEESGISKGLFVKILGELQENRQISRKVGERVIKTVTYRIQNLNDLGIKSRTPIGNTSLPTENHK